MNNTLRTIGCALLLLCLSTGKGSATNGNITVTVQNFSGFANTFNLRDERCGNSTTVQLAPWGTAPMPLCTSDAGYGSLLYKRTDHRDWTRSALLSNGEVVKM